MKIGKKFLIMLLFMLVVLCCTSNGTVKAANVSTFAQLKTALEAAGTDTITLTSNINVTSTIKVVGTKTIVGAYTLKNTISSPVSTASNAIFEVKQGATLTLGNASTTVTLDGNNKMTIASSTIVTDGTVNIVKATLKNGTQGIYVSNKGTLNMSGGTIDQTNLNAGIVNYGTTKVTGGTIKSPGIGILCNGTSTAPSTLTMSGGTIVDYDENGIELQNYSSATISGTSTEIKKTDVPAVFGHAIYHKGTSLTITGGKFGDLQSIYLVGETRFISIGNSKPTFQIEPEAFTRGRIAVKTSVTLTDALEEELSQKITVKSPKGDTTWALKKDGQNLKIWEATTILIRHVYLDQYDRDASNNPKKKNAANMQTRFGWGGSTYTTSPISDPKYTLTATPSNASGTISGEDINVEYVYTKKTANITVKYKDNAGAVLDTEVITRYVDDQMVFNPKEIAGYKCMDTAVTKTFGTDTLVEFTYAKQTTVTVQYIDQETGNNVVDSSTGIEKTPISTIYDYGSTFDQRRNDYIYGYTYLNTEVKTAGGVVYNQTTTAAENLTVTHYYAKKTQVIVKHLDKNNKNREVASSQVIDGYYGLAYTTSNTTVPGYTYKGATDDHTANVSGNMTTGTITVEYYYVKLLDITVRYLDLATTREIPGYPAVTTTYEQNQTIDQKKLTIPGYTYAQTTPTMTVVGDSNATITHYYNATTSLVVKHLDKYNHDIEIEPTQTTEGYLGKPYSVNALTSLPSNYVYRNDNSGNTSGNMGAGATVVEFYYTKRVPVTVRFVDLNTGNELSGYPATTTVYDQGTEYDPKYVPSIGAYTYLSTQVDGTSGNLVGPDNITVTHYYSTNTQVVVRHLDKNNHAVSVGTAQLINGYVGETYRTSPLSGAKLPTNYVYKGNNSGNTTGTITGGSIVIDYYYVKQIPVTIKYVNRADGQVLEEIKDIVDQGTALDKKSKSIAGYTFVETTVEGTSNNTVGAEDITVTHYYSKAATVLVRHLDKNDHAKEIAEPTIIDGVTGQPYTAQPLASMPARYVYRGDSTSNFTGTFTDEQIVVELYYTRQSKVTVEYVDVNSGETMESVDGYYDERSTLDKKQKSIAGYTYLNTEVTGTTDNLIGTEDIVVKHYYSKDSTILIKYLDKNNNAIEIGPSKTVVGYEGKFYRAEKLEMIPTNYVYREDNSGNTTGYMSAGQTVVTYYYTKRVPVSIKYVDKETGDVLDQRIDIYDEASDLDQKFKEMQDYTFLETVVTGCDGRTVGPDDITVTHYYARNTTILVKHLDLNNRKIEVGPSEVIEGYEGKDYTTSILEDVPSNYEYQNNNSGNTTGKMARNQLVIEYYYVKQVPVTVQYVNKYSGEILEEVVDIYSQNDTFDKKQKDIDNYTYQETTVEGTTNDTVGPDDITVTHYYAINTSVLVKYLDKYNHDIEVGASVEIPGFEGKEYTTEPLANIPSNYVYQEDNSGNTEGNMAAEQIIVEYYYVKQVPVTVQYVDKFTNEVLDSVTTIYDQTSVMDKKEKEIDGYSYYETIIEGADENGLVGPDDITITHVYIKKSNLTLRFVDRNNGQDILPSITTEYLEGDDYTVYAKDIGGYVLDVDESFENGVKGHDDETIIFYYKKVSGGIIVKYVDEITNDLLHQKVYEGRVGDTIVTEANDYVDYALVSQPTNNRFTMQEEYQEVVYGYKKRIRMMVKGEDIVDNTVLWEYELDGIEGEPYYTSYKYVENYTLVDNIDTISGNFSRNTSEIIYKYKTLTRKGDMNLDTYINSTDAAIVLDLFKNGNATAKDYDRGDMDENGVINAIDAAMIIDIFKNEI